MTQQNRRHPGRELLSRIELPFQTSICFPPFESIRVRKGKRHTEGSEQESNDWNKILSYLQHFHKNSEISTRKTTHQSFPADSGFLCSPHEARDFCLRLPVCESAQPTKHQLFTDSTRPQGKDENGFNKTVSNTAGHLFFCLLMSGAEPQSLK